MDSKLKKFYTTFDESRRETFKTYLKNYMKNCTKEGDNNWNLLNDFYNELNAARSDDKNENVKIIKTNLNRQLLDIFKNLKNDFVNQL